jgi:hypothetical protein
MHFYLYKYIHIYIYTYIYVHLRRMHIKLIVEGRSKRIFAVCLFIYGTGV